MFGFFSKKKKIDNAANELFLKVISHTRIPLFYENFGVEDNLDGRFDLMSVHMALIIDVLDNNNQLNDAIIVRRRLQEIMFDNLDLTLREIGVGDLGVGKKIKTMAEAFYGRMTTYQECFKTHDTDQMSMALKRNLYRGRDMNEAIVVNMTSYVYGQYKYLSSQPSEDVIAGNVDFMEPKWMN